MAATLLSNVKTMINPEVLKCPVKKGFYKACEFKEKLKVESIPALPFMKLGQRLEVSFIVRSVVNKKREMLCTTVLHYIISNKEIETR